MIFKTYLLSFRKIIGRVIAATFRELDICNGPSDPLNLKNVKCPLDRAPRSSFVKIRKSYFCKRNPRLHFKQKIRNFFNFENVIPGKPTIPMKGDVIFQAIYPYIKCV